jgi:hypothetical protein
MRTVVVTSATTRLGASAYHPELAVLTIGDGIADGARARDITQVLPCIVERTTPT